MVSSSTGERGEHPERICRPLSLGILLGLVTYSLVFLKMILVHWPSWHLSLTVAVNLFYLGAGGEPPSRVSPASGTLPGHSTT
jgi:hypothetical protein